MQQPTSYFPDDAYSNDFDREMLLDDLFEILASRRRRYLLRCLQAHETPIALADVADEVAVYENETDITDISAEEIKRVYMSLYHTHIPKLAERDLINYSQEQDLVTLSDNGEQLGAMEIINDDYL